MVTPVPHAPIVPRADLATFLVAWRTAGARIVFTNGVFDLMHIGHLRYLQMARAMGDLLVVGINGDASTRRLKGPTRPLVPEAERAEMVAGLGCVEAVTIFTEDTAEELVRLLQPEVYVKGGDYTISNGNPGTPSATGVGMKPLPEAAIVLAYGGRVELVPYVPGHSTTELIDRIVEGSRNLPSVGG
jgi:rfaE bifunctional protein nucleotidyltransferase chain/domain